MKKMTTFVCVAAITASLLAGCGSKTAETTAASTEAAAATEAASTEAAVECTDAARKQPRRLQTLLMQFMYRREMTTQISSAKKQRLHGMH